MALLRWVGKWLQRGLRPNDAATIPAKARRLPRAEHRRRHRSTGKLAADTAKQVLVLTVTGHMTAQVAEAPL